MEVKATVYNIPADAIRLQILEYVNDIFTVVLAPPVSKSFAFQIVHFENGHGNLIDNDTIQWQIYDLLFHSRFRYIC